MILGLDHHEAGDSHHGESGGGHNHTHHFHAAYACGNLNDNSNHLF